MSAAVASLRRWGLLSQGLSRRWTRASPSISLLASAWSVDSPAIWAMGIRGGGADTASGRAIPWGVSDPDG